MVAVPAEEPGELLLRGLTNGHHAVAAVDPLEKKFLQLLLACRDGRGMLDDPHAPPAIRPAKRLPHLGHRVDAERFEPAAALGDQFRDLKVDQFVEHGAALLHGVELFQRAVAVANPRRGVGHERQLDQFLERHEPQFDRVVGIVRVVGDRVGGIDHLRFEERCGSRAVFFSRGLGFEHLAGEIQPGKVWVTGFEKLHNPQRLGVVVEAPCTREQIVERVFAGMPERRVADVVPERQRLDEILVERQRPRERAGDARDLERVGEAAAVVVAMVAGEDLRLVGQPAERGRMDDPVAVALVWAAEEMQRLGMNAAGRVGGMHRPGGEEERFAALPIGGGHRRASVRWPTSCSQRASSACGKTRTPAVVGMKFTSPCHRGTMCQWRWPGSPAPATEPRLRPMLNPCACIESSMCRHQRARPCCRSSSSSAERAASVARWSSGATSRWPLE